MQMSETINKMDRDKRKKKLRADSQAEWREKMNYTKVMQDITKAEEELLKIANEDDNLSAYRLLLDSKWKKINKLLPDIKETVNVHEHTGDAFNEILLKVVDGSDSGKT